MEADLQTLDRSGQFGRLLAVLEKVERDTYSDNETREPAAMRMLSVFSRRPMHTAAEIEKQLERAYFPRLRPVMRHYYKALIGEIMERICTGDQAEWDKPLGETYLVGYYLQRKKLYTKKENSVENEEEQ